MKSMKWRNAYLLFYERKTPDDINLSDEESINTNNNSGVGSPDVEMKSVN
jgi:hypothetical protein